MRNTTKNSMNTKIKRKIDSNGKFSWQIWCCLAFAFKRFQLPVYQKSYFFLEKIHTNDNQQEELICQTFFFLLALHSSASIDKKYSFGTSLNWSEIVYRHGSIAVLKV
jgi:hypothetical protein